MKLELHWQILIGLILGIVFGVVFPTNFKVTDDSIANLKGSKVPDEIIESIVIHKDMVPKTQSEFVKDLKKDINPEVFDTYGKTILKESKYNPY
ncbi:MAG: hypothetical protein B6I20_12035, partial [Bacteroidetes bacterium 4572_117]